MEETSEKKKKGLSKGCIVGLVIVSVLVVLVVIGGILCYANKDALFKMGMTTVVNGIKVQLVENPIEGIDSTTYNAVADKFIEKLDTDEALDPDKMAAFGSQMQTIGTNMDNLTADDVNTFMKAMVKFYPDLKELIPAPTETEAEEMTEEGTDSAPVIE